MALNQFAIVKAVANGKPRKLSDGDGLYLLVQPNGRKQWRFRYRFAGRENTVSFGAFPAVALAQARDKRHEAKKLLAAGTDPSVQKKLDRVAAATSARNTFGAVAAEYIDNLKANGAVQNTIDKNVWLLNDLAAPLTKRPVASISPAEILLLLKRIEMSGRRDTARRLRGVMGSVFRYAIVTLRATNDPTSALRGALLQPIVKHRAAITDEGKLGGLMTSIDEYDGWPTLRAALQLVALTMTRPGDVRLMKRGEIHFMKAMWRIPAERMKMRRPHDVPLSRQALAILREIWPLSENNELVLPSIRSARKALSENAMNSALRRMGYSKDDMTAHGFRSSASTILNERGFDGDVIEAALAHQEEDDVRRAYNRATYLPERIKLMQAWADILDELKTGSMHTRAA